MLLQKTRETCAHTPAKTCATKTCATIGSKLVENAEDPPLLPSVSSRVQGRAGCGLQKGQMAAGGRTSALLIVGLLISQTSSQSTCQSSTRSLVGACAGMGVTTTYCYESAQNTSVACTESLAKYSSTLLTTERCSIYLGARCSAIAGASLKSPPQCGFMCGAVPAISSCMVGSACTSPPGNFTHAVSGAICPFPTTALPTANHLRLCCKDLMRAIEAGCNGIECGVLLNYMNQQAALGSAKGGCDDATNGCTSNNGLSTPPSAVWSHFQAPQHTHSFTPWTRSSPSFLTFSTLLGWACLVPLLQGALPARAKPGRQSQVQSASRVPTR